MRKPRNKITAGEKLLHSEKENEDDYSKMSPPPPPRKKRQAMGAEGGEAKTEFYEELLVI